MRINVLVCVVAATVASGCVAGRLGGRVDLSGDKSQSGLYGGPMLYPPPLVVVAGDSDPRLGVPISVESAMMFTGKGKKNFATFSPAIGFVSGSEFLIAFGGFLSLGIEIGIENAPAFHAGLCGGAFSIGALYACGRFSTAGWYGFDGNLAISGPFHFEVEDGEAEAVYLGGFD